jgi:general secretion pathway protein B
MSLILDALKKLDREKSSGRSRPGNLALEILKPDFPLSPRRIPLYLGIFSITAVATAGITYAVIAGFGYLSKSSTPPPANFPQPSQQSALASRDSLSPSPPAFGNLPPSNQQGTAAAPETMAHLQSFPATPVILPTPSKAEAPVSTESTSPSKIVPPANPPVTIQQAAPAPLPREPVREAREEISRVSPKIQAPADGKPPLPVPAEKQSSGKVISKETTVAPGIMKKTVEQNPDVSATGPPVLKLSGILWHEDPLERRAVINGMVLTEGNVIEGVKVLEIHPTHVRLSHKDRPFEISMFR